MSALADQIAEVLKAHHQVFDERGHINGTVPGNGAWDCQCGEIYNTTFESVTAHVAERIAELFTEETVTLNEYAARNGEPAQVRHRYVSPWTAEEPKP